MRAIEKGNSVINCLACFVNMGLAWCLEKILAIHILPATKAAIHGKNMAQPIGVAEGGVRKVGRSQIPKNYCARMTSPWMSATWGGWILTSFSAMFAPFKHAESMDKTEVSRLRMPHLREKKVTKK